MPDKPMKRLLSAGGIRKYPKVSQPDSYVQQVKDREQSQQELARWWDMTYSGGEGELKESHRRGRKCFCQWVRILSPDRERLGELLLFSTDEGECYRVAVAGDRAPLPPNPYDNAGISRLFWDSLKMGAGYVPAMVRVSDDGRYTLPPVGNPARPDDVRPHDPETGQLDYRADPRTRAVFENGQLQGKILPLPAGDGDIRFQFRCGGAGFVVRGSKLAPVLLKLRGAGVQDIPLGLLQKALSHAV